jgi:putative polyhydroxyalkanoate system protein
MADIRMIKYHSLPIKTARELVQKAADNLAEEYDLSSQWAGNTLRFRRSGVQGEMRVNESEIDLEVTLGFLLKAFKSKFVEHIEHSFDTLLQKAQAADKRGAGEPKADKAATRTKRMAKPAKRAGRKA